MKQKKVQTTRSVTQKQVSTISQGLCVHLYHHINQDIMHVYIHINYHVFERAFYII